MDYRHGRRSPYLRIVVFVVWNLFSVAAYAGVTVIDRAAQEQLLQQERERQLRDQQEITPDVRLPAPAPSPEHLVYPDSESPCFNISSVSLIGESASKFQFALSDITHGENAAIGRCLGAQGVKGTLFGVTYEAGSFIDKLIEAFGGPHDYIGGQGAGFYDEQGNAPRGRSKAEKLVNEAWSVVAIVPSAPFGAATLLPPEIWKAISIYLGASK